MSLVTPGPLHQARFRPPMSALSPEPPFHSESFSTTHALTLILTILLLVLFFVGFFSIYFCRCFMDNLMGILNSRGRNPMGTPVNPSNPDPPGLDPAIIESFPAFDYSSVKDYRPTNYGLECAICLSEFQEDDVIRLIPECCHVFHTDCIDLWLASHKSCPVCRRSLDPDDNGPDPGPDRPVGDIEARGPGDEGSSCSVTVKEDSPLPVQRRMAFCGEGRFSRSHSTGHSIVRINEAATGADKYTLRLPEHVIKETITRGHVQTLSCTTFGEMSRGNAQGRSCFGEISGDYNTACTQKVKQ